MFALLGRAITSRLAGPAASAVAVLFLGLAVTQCGRADALGDQLAKAQDRIENPKTGLVVQLRTCRLNEGRLDAAVQAQNAALGRVSAEGLKAVAQAADAVAEAELGRAAAEDKARRVLAVKPAGLDACADLKAVDAAVMETLR